MPTRSQHSVNICCYFYYTACCEKSIYAKSDSQEHKSIKLRHVPQLTPPTSYPTLISAYTRNVPTSTGWAMCLLGNMSCGISTRPLWHLGKEEWHGCEVSTKTQSWGLWWPFAFMYQRNFLIYRKTKQTKTKNKPQMKISETRIHS